MTLRDGKFAAKNNGFLNLEIENDSKIIVDSYNRKINIHVSIMLLMENIWKLAHDLDIYICRHVYKEENRTANCLAKKRISILESSVWWSNFLNDMVNVSFEDYCGYFFNGIC